MLVFRDGVVRLAHRCVGESTKSLPAGDWFCPECRSLPVEVRGDSKAKKSFTPQVCISHRRYHCVSRRLSLCVLAISLAVAITVSLAVSHCVSSPSLSPSLSLCLSPSLTVCPRPSLSPSLSLCLSQLGFRRAGRDRCGRTYWNVHNRLLVLQVRFCRHRFSLPVT